ncbi:MAG TPA: acyltransferase [Mucilaginibacter sp.]
MTLEPPTDKTRIYSVQNLRGIAALMVCIFHLTSNLNIIDPLKRVSIFGYLGVQIFFVISGFVIPWSLYNEHYKLKNFFSYLLKRFTRIEPPYVVSIFLFLFLNYLAAKTGIYRGAPFLLDIKQLLLNIVYLPKCFGFNWIQPVYPTLLVEFQFYILIGLIFPLLKSDKKLIIYGIVAVFIAASYLLPVTIFSFIDLFLIGIIYFKYRIGHLKSYEFWILEITIMTFTWSTNPDLCVGAAELVSLIAIIYWDSANKITQFLGKISYSLYLIHVPIGGKIINFGNRYAHSISINYLIIIIALTVSIICSWIFYTLVELPSIKLSKQVIKNYS